MRVYSPLAHQRVPQGSHLAHPTTPGRVVLDDPARSVMTDLQVVPAATISPGESIDLAHGMMIRRSVRLLFVLDHQDAVAGVITATDLLSEKPMRVMQSRGVKHGEVHVADIMTPTDRLETLALADVSQMRVGHVVATLKAAHRQHLLVAEDGGRRIRGLFSASQVARQLGIELQTFEVAQTFADIEAALAR